MYKEAQYAVWHISERGTMSSEDNKFTGMWFTSLMRDVDHHDF